MAKRSSSIGWVVAGLALLTGGVAIAATSKPSRKPEGSGEDSERGAQGPAPIPQLRDPDVSDSDWAAKVDEHRRGFAAASQQLAEWGKQKRAEDEADAESQKTRTEAAAGISVVGGTIASLTGPIAGPVIALIVAGIAAMVRYTKSWGGIITGGDRREFTGWREGSYHYRDIPVYGPEAERFWAICERVTVRQEQLEAFKALVAAYPNGPGPSEVAISSTGDYDYLFNPSRPGDLSQRARDALEVFGQQVYVPADVTLRGPRGFEPKNPRSWKVPGERLNVRDRVVRLDPARPASGT